MPEFRLVLLILAFGVPVAGVVLLIAHFTKARAFPKYIPAIVLFLLTVLFVVLAMQAKGMEGLGHIILAMLAVGAGVVALLTAIGVDIYRAVKRRPPVRPPVQPDGQGRPQPAPPYNGEHPQQPAPQQPAAGEPSPQQAPPPPPAQGSPPEPGQNPPQEPPKQG